MLQMTSEQMLRGLAGHMFQMFEKPEYQVAGKELIHVFFVDGTAFRLAFLAPVKTKEITEQLLANERFVEIQLDGQEVLVGMSAFNEKGTYDAEGPGTRYVQEDDESADHFIEEIVKDVHKYLTTGAIPQDVVNLH